LTNPPASLDVASNEHLKSVVTELIVRSLPTTLRRLQITNQSAGLISEQPKGAAACCPFLGGKADIARNRRNVC
jgi:hypothetical protein